MSMLYSVSSVSSDVVVSSGAGVSSVSVSSGCVGVGLVAEGSGVVVALSVGVLLGVVGVVGVVGAVGSVDGSAVKNPMNVLVPIGMRMKDVFEATGGFKEEPENAII